MNKLLINFNLLVSLLFFNYLPLIAQDSRGVKVASTSQSQFKNVYGLIVGVSDYKYAKSLKYADNDADLMTKVIEHNFPESKGKIIQLVNEQATEVAIKSSLWQINKNVKDGDLVIFYFAGHGDVANVEASQKGYFLGYNASSSREYEAGGALRFDDLHDSIVKITSKGAKVYLITDACRSGTIVDAKGTSLTLNALNTGYQSTTKFISCQANELSYEYDTLAHGAFTYYLAKSLMGEADVDEINTKISVIELDTYLTKKVRNATEKQQTPTIMGSDKFAEIFNCDPNVVSYFSIPNQNNELAKRGSGDELKAKTAFMIKYEDALLNRDLYGKSTSAKFLLDNAQKAKTATLEELDEMKFKLAEALLDRYQEDMNRFLTGKPLVDKNENYQATVNDLKMAGELLGANHPMSKTIQNRAAFFEAMEILRSGDQTAMSKAESTLIVLEKAEPKSTYIHQGLAMLYVAKNNKDNAQAQLQKAENMISTWDKPRNTDAYLNILIGKLDRTLEQLKASENVSSDKSDVYFLRSNMHLANFQLMEAQKELNKIENSSPGSYKTERAIVLGKIEELRGRVKYAESTYKDILKTDETNVSILLGLANLYRNQNDTLNAKEFYNKVLKSEPTNLQAKNALTALNNGIVNSTSLNYYDRDEILAHLKTLEKSKKNEEALTVINKVLEVNNWSPENYYQKGKFLYNLNRKAESAEALKKAIEISPYHYESIRALVYILIEQKKITEADAIIKQHDKYFLSSTKWLTFQYNAYRLMNSKNDLFVLLERAIKMDSFDLEPYRALFKLHVENNGFLNGQRELNTLLTIGGDEKDSDYFLFLTDKQVKEQFFNHNYYPLNDGIELLLKENSLDLDYLYMGSMIAYMNKYYEKSNTHLRNISKFVQSLTPGALLDYYKLKGKVLLESGNFEEAEKAFQYYNSKAGKPCYLGLAMAQFELGKKDSWIINFKKDMDMTDFNEDANVRFQKMLKKAGM